MKKAGLLLLFLYFSSYSVLVSAHSHGSQHAPAASLESSYDDELKTLKEKLVLLEGKAFMPTILPVVMQNQESLQLTETQVAHFMDWRKIHLKKVIALMTAIIEKHIAFKKMTLNPGYSSDDLFSVQNEIFELQREVLALKLECREFLAQSFSQEQWDDFNFILSDHPTLASFLN